MKNIPWKTILNRTLLALTLGALPALAGPENVGLGTGRNGSLTVSVAGNTIINSYAQVTAPLAPGDTSIPVGTCLGAATCFAAGDLVMVLQTTGIVPEPPSGSPTTFELTDDPVGRWEFARLASVAGPFVSLTQPLLYSYAGNVTQIIRVPEYVNVTINVARNVTPFPWNGRVGGVVAFLAQGTFTNNGAINASGRGFRGGQPVDDPSGALGCEGLDEPAPRGAQKGEGIALMRYGTSSTGRGSVANAGAGGVCFNSGGGGGGNGGAGGRGGNTNDGNRARGGEGGGSLRFSMVDHLMMGGGGGAGHSTNVAGGAGGGIVFLRAYQMNGSGGILANGNSGGGATNAGSGGGAGGTIHLQIFDKATCGSIRAIGGVGGTSDSSAMGPGGGGGGGRVLLQMGPDSTCAVTASAVVGGLPGVQMDPGAPGGASYGAEAGVMGITTLSLLPAPVVLTPANNSSSNDATPDYSGTLSPPYPAGTEVVIYVDNAEVGKVTPDTAGGWSFTQPANLSNGFHTVYAVALNRSRGAQSAPGNINIFTVDTTPPDAPRVTTPANGSATRDNTPVYSGTAEAGSTVTVVVDEVVVGVVTANASGGWSVTPVDALPNGTHGVRARATDVAGNTGADSDTHFFTVDTLPPDAPRISTPANGSATNSNRPLYSGTAEAGSTVTVVVNWVEVGTTLANAWGEWTLRPALPLVDGTYGVSARATDVAGNTGADSDTHLFTVDTLPPTAPMLLTPANSSTTHKQPTYSGSAEAGSTVTVVVDGVVVGTTTVDASGGWIFLQPTLTAGGHTVRVRARDMVDNTGADSDTHFFTVDTTPPATPRLSTPANDAKLNGNQPLYGGTAEEGSLVTVLVDGVVVGTTWADASGRWSFPQPVALADVRHTLRVRATDGAGNTGADSDTHLFTVDTAPPAAPRVTAPDNGSTTRDSTLVYSGTAEAGSTVTVFVDEVVVGTTTAQLSGEWTLEAVSALADGIHGVRTRTRDVAGNTSADSDTHFFVDTTPPASPRVIAPANGSATHSNLPLYSGMAEGGSTVRVMVNGVMVGTTTADAQGEWSLKHAVPMADGTFRMNVQSTDVAGNTGAISDTHLFMVDTVPPATPVVTAPGASSIHQTPVIGGTAEPDSEVTVRLDGEEVIATVADASGNWSFTPSTPLRFGNYSISVTARDGAGNASPDSSPYRFAIERPRSHYGWSCASAPAVPAAWALLALGLLLGKPHPRAHRRQHSQPAPAASPPARAD